MKSQSFRRYEELLPGRIPAIRVIRVIRGSEESCFV